MSVKARHQHPIASRHPFPEGTFRWERPDSAGVTQEHLRGPETGGFPGVAPVFCPDPPYGSGWGSGFAVWPMNTGVVLYGKCDGGCDTGPRPVTGCHGILRLAGGAPPTGTCSRDRPSPPCFGSFPFTLWITFALFSMSGFGPRGH